MLQRHRVIYISLLHDRLRKCLLCIALSLCLVPPTYAVEVIVNPTDYQKLIQGRYDLRSIFSMRTRYWANGEKIRVFVLPDNNPLHKTFVKEKLQMFPHQLRRAWNRMTYTGTGQPPITVDSVEEMLEKIKTTPYSIGYIDRRVNDKDIHYLNTH